jgi:nicotinamidase-related amidase
MAADGGETFPNERFLDAPAALIVVDMQIDFVERGAPVMAEGGLAIVPGINRLVSVARRSGTPVIFTHEVHRADGSDYGIELEYDPRHCEEGTEGAQLLPALDVGEGDLHVYKRRYDAFFGTDLDLLLRSLNIKNLVFCGVDTDICVLGSVVSARNHDYRVAVVEDCCAGSSMEAHRAALVCMGTVFGHVVRSTDADKMFPGFGAVGPHY